MEYNESTKFFRVEDEDLDLWFFLMHARDVMFRARELELQRYGITPEQVSLLFVVQAMDNQATQADLAHYLLRRPNTESALVNRMAKKGLVKKVKDLKRENSFRVVITGEGQQAYEQSIKRGPIHRIMGELKPEEKKQFHKYLEKIYAKARQEIGIE